MRQARRPGLHIIRPSGLAHRRWARLNSTLGVTFATSLTNSQMMQPDPDVEALRGLLDGLLVSHKRFRVSQSDRYLAVSTACGPGEAFDDLSGAVGWCKGVRRATLERGIGTFIIDTDPVAYGARVFDGEKTRELEIDLSQLDYLIYQDEVAALHRAKTARQASVEQSSPAERKDTTVLFLIFVALAVLGWVAFNR